MELMAHFYYGDPSEEFSLKLAKTLLEAGTDILEVGIPYTDPVCDGEVFQRACQRALASGITPFKVLEGIGKIRGEKPRRPIYLTSYYAPIFKIGIEKFIGLAKEGGVWGLIVPDILLEEQTKLRDTCQKYGLSLIQFATVYSTKKRLEEIGKASADFIYCISLPGVTGESFLPFHSGDRHTNVELERLIGDLKKITDKKIMVGFGIKTKEEAKKILRLGADGVIVGSAIARIYEENIKRPFETLPQISAFIKSLKESKIKE